MTKSIFAMFVIVTLMSVGVLRSTTPKFQEETVKSQLLLWSAAIEDYEATQCGSLQNQSDKTLLNTDASFEHFGLNWSYSASTRLTTLTIDSARDQNAHLSPSRALALIELFGAGQRPTTNTSSVVLERDAVRRMSSMSAVLGAQLFILNDQRVGDC